VRLVDREQQLLTEGSGSPGEFVAGVASKPLFGVGPARRAHPGHTVAHLHAPVALVDVGVMPRTQQNHRVDVGGAAAGPPRHVVGFASAGGHGAAGGGAAAVAGREGLALGGGRRPHAAPEIEDRA
jgi:hypothetical protein